MHIVRYRAADSGVIGVGVNRTSIDDQVRPLAGYSSVADLMQLTVAELRTWCEAAAESPGLTGSVQMLAPVDGLMEVWAAGVTYLWSRDARVEESRRFGEAYTLVYDAERPELFFKSTAWRVSGDSDPIAIRDDSKIDVPEPELAVVVNRHGEIAGYTLCNDMSSRTIEAENPLYLPQAKVFLGGCAVGPTIRPVWEIDNPYDLTISLDIIRDTETVWSGSTSTSQLNRKLDKLVSWLFHADDFPDGVVLSTGTCLVPDLPFTLRADDRVRIEIAGIGRLENPVVRGKAAILLRRDERRR